MISSRMRLLWVMLILFGLMACSGAEAQIEPTLTLVPSSTPSPEPTNTPLPTDTPQPTNTSVPTATPSPIPTATLTPEPIIFTTGVENLIHVDEDNLHATSYVLFISTSTKFDADLLARSELHIEINGNDKVLNGFTFTPDIEKHDGFVFRYNEKQFQNSDQLSVNIKLFDKNGVQIGKSQEYIVPNYSKTGLFTFPVDRSLIGLNNSIFPYSLDETLNGTSTFPCEEGYIANPRNLHGFYPGVPDNSHGNAFDLGDRTANPNHQVTWNSMYTAEVNEISDTENGRVILNLPVRVMISPQKPIGTPEPTFSTATQYRQGKVLLDHFYSINPDLGVGDPVPPGTYIGNINDEVHVEFFSEDGYSGEPPYSNGIVQFPFKVILSEEDLQLVCDLYTQVYGSGLIIK